MTLDHPEIFLVQARAMLKASEGLNNLRILLPMISGTHELEEALHLLHRAWGEVLTKSTDVPMPPIGVMIEIPAAVLSRPRSWPVRSTFCRWVPTI